MSDATFILLAGGNQRRWNNYTGVPKHLAVVGGEPVIVRTCRQIKDRLGIHPLVVAHDPKIVEAVGEEHCFTGHNKGFIAAGALSTRSEWKARTWIMDGDAYWDKASMDQVCALEGLRAVWAQSPPQFMGFHWDSVDGRQRVEAALRTTVLAAHASKEAAKASYDNIESERNSGSSRDMGYMLYAFHCMQGLPLCDEPHTLNGGSHRRDDPMTTLLLGKTVDFDNPYDYDGFLSHCRLDDLPPA